MDLAAEHLAHRHDVPLRRPPILTQRVDGPSGCHCPLILRQSFLRNVSNSRCRTFNDEPAGAMTLNHFSIRFASVLKNVLRAASASKPIWTFVKRFPPPPP